MAFIPQGKDIPMGSLSADLPDMSDGILSWLIPMTAERVVKQTIAGEEIEDAIAFSFMGVIQPQSNRDLSIKAEGQRARTWYWLHCLTDLSFNVDDVFRYGGKQYRVMALKDWKEYGYYSYEILEDWTGAGPEVVTP